MALPNELGAGGTAFHGDQAIRVRAILNSVATAGVDIADLQTAVTALAVLANELKSEVNGLLAKLDADAADTQLNDTNYAATHAVSAPSVTYP